MPIRPHLWAGRDRDDDSDHHWIEVPEPIQRPPAPEGPPPPPDRTRFFKRALAVAAASALLATGALAGVTLLEDDEPESQNAAPLAVSGGRLPANRINQIY